ncbi:MAG: hypothetical protein WCH39_26365, partial [Schlesneria sp.]
MTITTPIPMGIQGVMYVGVAGTTPTTLLNDDQKLELSIKNGVAKWATRGKPRKDSGFTDQEITATMTVIKNNTNMAFLRLQAAAQTRTAVAIKSLDALGGYGVDCDWLIESYKEGQPIDGND